MCSVPAPATAELLTGDAAAPYAAKINAKYLTEAALGHPVIGPAFTEMSNLVIKLVPDKWISWDMGELGEQLLEPDADESLYFHPTLS